MVFRDHFAGVASAYATFRPAYPEALFDWLASVTPGRGLAWDCACGSGQATASLAGRFSKVVATDASLSQLHNAAAVNNAVFVEAVADAAPLRDGSLDLVTVASALHWFAGEPFFNEVRRVLVPGGVIAAWTYGLPILEDPDMAAVVSRFSDHTLGPYWPDEVCHVMDGYAEIPFPFPEIDAPRFELTAEWTLPQLLGFMGTWSATAGYLETLGDDPIQLVAQDIASLWGRADTTRRLSWTLALRAGRL